jgi:hypothetical protein
MFLAGKELVFRSATCGAGRFEEYIFYSKLNSP